MRDKQQGRHRRRADKGSLPGLASRALGWSFASNLIARVGTLPIGIVLARLLGPHAFGTYAVALVALVALLSFNDLSVSLAIVRWKGDPAQIAPTVATLSVAASLLIYAACYLIAPSFAWAMGAPAATSVVRVLSLNVVVDGLAAAPAAMLQRQFRQDRKMIADQVNNWLGAAVSIVLAFAGFGAMSLALGRVAGGAASVILFFIFSPVRFGFDRTKARALMKFGLPLAGSSIVAFAVANADQLIVGHVLGATALGFYALAVNLAGWPVTMFSLPTRSVAPAVFSRLQHDKKAMRSGFVSVAGLLGAVTIPFCLLLAGAGLPIVAIVYGQRWVPAAAALTGLGVLSALRVGFELCYDYFVVLARSRTVLVVQVVWLVALVPGLIVGTVADGISGAAFAQAAVAGCIVLPCYLLCLAMVGIKATALARRLWLPVTVAVVVAAAAAVAARFISTDLIALGIGCGAGLVGFGLLASRMRPALAELRANLVPVGIKPAGAVGSQ
ncbi:MAG TPA: oligosaccharide flippase family protein [Streptosporangiaceae bacterium]|nr:oligosaccharide flippase family protein [Streptosporangiaceae bacterium]